MQKLGGFSNRLPFCCFRLRFRLRSSPICSAPSSASFTLPPSPSPRSPHFAHARAHSRASADFRFLPSPFTDLSQLTVYQHTRGEHLSTLSPSPFLHLPSRDSPQPATEKPHFFQHFPRISLATLPASPTAKSATEQVKAFSSKPSLLTL